MFYDQGTWSVSFEVKNDVFQICLILMFCIAGKWNSMFPKFCGIKYLWTIFMTGQRQSFSERTYFWRNTTLDATVWGKIWNALILVDNNVFVLQATQSINSPNLEVLRLQVHFLQHVKLPCFRRGHILTEHRLLKFDCVVQKNWKGNFKVFTPNV